MDPQILIIAAFLAFFYFVSIRPQQKKAKAHALMVDSLTVGVDVVTVSGLHGRVAEIGDQTIDLEVTSDGVVLRFQKAAIRDVVGVDISADADVDADGASAGGADQA